MVQGRTGAATRNRRTHSMWLVDTAIASPDCRPTPALSKSRSSQLSCGRSLSQATPSLRMEIRSSHLPSSFVAQTYHSPKVIHNLTLLVPSAKNQISYILYADTHNMRIHFFFRNFEKWKTFLHDKEAHNLAWSNNVKAFAAESDCIWYAKCGHPPKLGII